MFMRFASGNKNLAEVKNGVYQNSRILVFFNRDPKAALPYELQIDLVRQPIRFKTADAAWDHAIGQLDERRRLLDMEAAGADMVPAIA